MAVVWNTLQQRGSGESPCDSIKGEGNPRSLMGWREGEKERVGERERERECARDRERGRERERERGRGSKRETDKEKQTDAWSGGFSSLLSLCGAPALGDGAT